MANEISNELIFETLKTIQAHVVRIPKLEAQVADLQAIVREGFAALKSHIFAAHSDQLALEQRMLTLENWMTRVRRELDITDHAP